MSSFSNSFLFRTFFVPLSWSISVLSAINNVYKPKIDMNRSWDRWQPVMYRRSVCMPLWNEPKRNIIKQQSATWLRTGVPYSCAHTTSEDHYLNRWPHGKLHSITRAPSWRISLQTLGISGYLARRPAVGCFTFDVPYILIYLLTYSFHGAESFLKS